jgi:hypothetical protein
MPSSVLSPSDVAPYWLTLPIRPYTANAARTVGPFAARLPSAQAQEVHPLVGFSPLQSQPASKRTATEAAASVETAMFPARGHSASHPKPATHSLSSASLEVFSPSAPKTRRVLFSSADASARERQQLCLGCNLSAFRVSHPLDGFLLAEPRQFVSPGKRSWGLGALRPFLRCRAPCVATRGSVDGCLGRTETGPPHEGGVEKTSCTRRVSTRCTGPLSRASGAHMASSSRAIHFTVPKRSVANGPHYDGKPRSERGAASHRP